MGKVAASATVSLDGYIAFEDNSIGHLFEIAGDKTVGVAAGVVAEQALRAGLLDEVAIDLAPVFLGQGKKYFPDLDLETVLGDPTTVIVAKKVTHLVFPVLK